MVETALYLCEGDRGNFASCPPVNSRCDSVSPARCPPGVTIGGRGEGVPAPPAQNGGECSFGNGAKFTRDFADVECQG